MELGFLIRVPVGKRLVKISTQLGAWILGDLLFLLGVFSLPSLALPVGDTFLIAHISGVGVATIVMFAGIGGGVLWCPSFLWKPCPERQVAVIPIFSGHMSVSSQPIRDGRGYFILPLPAMPSLPIRRNRRCHQDEGEA